MAGGIGRNWRKGNTGAGSARGDRVNFWGRVFRPGIVETSHVPGVEEPGLKTRPPILAFVPSSIQLQ
jgi:hypothetical protein